MRKRAFTLIELMVVVAIIAVIAAILVPNFLRARDTARQRGVTSVAATPQPEPAVPEGAANPAILGLDADLRVDNWTTRSGMDVTSRYRLTYAGAVRAQAPGLLRIPFPHKTEEAMNVRVRLRQANQEWEPDWTVTRWGLSIPLKGEQIVEASVRFETLGRDQLQLDLPPAARLGRVHLGLIAEEKGTELSELSLQPQQMPAPGHYTWDMQNLVSESPILLEMQGSHSLTGRVMLLCRLAGLAVLLFGLGFWYVGELYRPGCLSRFNWGHFLMLSLTYSSFFPALGVLTVSMGLPLFQALAIAAGLAQPLLIFHLWRTVNLRFALLYVLPLADLTLALVVNGVFGGQWREAFFLGAGFVAMAFVTLTYGRWRAHRQAWLDQQLQSLQDRIQSLVAQTEELPAYTKEKRIAEQAASLANYAERLNSGVYHFVTSQADSLEASLRTAGRTRPPANSPTPHCTGCGQPGCTNNFCAGCGNARIPIHTCACGTRLCVTARPEKDFFCPTCGQRSHLANSSK